MIPIVNSPVTAPVRRALGPVAVGLVLVGFALPTAADDTRAAPADLSGLPATVRLGLGRAAEVYPEPLVGVTWREVKPMNEGDRPHYQLSGTNGRDRAVELEITSAGRIIEVEEFGIPLDEVPEAVLEAAKARLPFANPDWQAAIYQAGKLRPVAYTLGGLDEIGNETEVTVSADGQTILN